MAAFKVGDKVRLSREGAYIAPPSFPLGPDYGEITQANAPLYVVSWRYANGQIRTGSFPYVTSELDLVLGPALLEEDDHA